MEGKLSKETVLKLSEEGISSYKVEFSVDSNFGTPGAVTVVNGYENELFLESITIQQNLHFSCKSWLQPNKLYPDKRIFFLNKVINFGKKFLYQCFFNNILTMHT